MRLLTFIMTVVGMTNAYKFAVLNDIHADVNYDPKSATCISKTLTPLSTSILLEGDEKPETYTAFRAQSIALLG